MNKEGELVDLALTSRVFAEHVIGNRLKRAGDQRPIKIDRRRCRMKIQGGAWVNYENAYQRFLEGERTFNWHKQKIAVDELLAALWGQTAPTQPGEQGFLTKNFFYGPSFNEMEDMKIRKI